MYAIRFHMLQCVCLLLYLYKTGVYVSSFLFVVPDGVRSAIFFHVRCMVPTCFCTTV